MNARKQWVLAFRWMPLNMNHSLLQPWRPSIPMAMDTQSDNGPCKNCSGIVWRTWQRAQSGNQGYRFPRSQSNQAYTGHAETNLIVGGPILDWTWHSIQHGYGTFGGAWQKKGFVEFKSVTLSPWIKLDGSIELESGNSEAESMSWALCHVPSAIPEQVFVVWQGAL